ncbi:MAG: hypothetical protein CR972_04210 [Candidatus Moraniibacteriota bacterium]|nr:MAG: hypothetical protein CR972_04210 [Candidatus Moranbacteria bacterium]
MNHNSSVVLFINLNQQEVGMQEVVTKQQKESLMKIFTEELKELKAILQKENTISMKVEKGDECDISSSVTQKSLNATMNNRRRSRIHRLDTILKEIPSWDFYCTNCGEFVQPSRVESSANMLCVLCAKKIQSKAKKNNGGHHAYI